MDRNWLAFHRRHNTNGQKTFEKMLSPAGNRGNAKQNQDTISHLSSWQKGKVWLWDDSSWCHVSIKQPKHTGAWFRAG